MGRRLALCIRIMRVQCIPFPYGSMSIGVSCLGRPSMVLFVFLFLWSCFFRLVLFGSFRAEFPYAVLNVFRDFWCGDDAHMCLSVAFMISSFSHSLVDVAGLSRRIVLCVMGMLACLVAVCSGLAVLVALLRRRRFSAICALVLWNGCCGGC